MHLNKKNTFAIICKLFLIFVLLDLFCCGSGRILTISGVTCRMILFSLSLLFSLIIFVIYNKGNTKVVGKLVFVQILLILLSVLVAVINNNNLNLLYIDIQLSLYVLAFIFFDFIIVDKSDINLIAKTCVFSGIILSGLILLITLAINLGIISYSEIYKYVNNNIGRDDISDLMVSEGRIFYKGSIYIGIALLFSLFYYKKWLYSIILIIGLFLSGTRGYILSLSTVLVIGLYIIIRNKIVLLLFAILMIIAVIYYLSLFSESDSNKIEGDSMRIQTIQQVFKECTFTSTLIGHGFGHGVEIRPDHFEISILEVFHKQGLLGVSFWIYLLFLNIKNFSKIVVIDNIRLALPYLLAVLYIYIESLTNPFMNNSIGFSFIMISTVSLLRLVHNPQYN